MSFNLLYRRQELAIRTLYAEVKQRAQAAGELLPGTPGSLVRRNTGGAHEYWYRSYYPVPNRRLEALVGRVDDSASYEAMHERMAESAWVSAQVATLARLGFQVADKNAAAVLVELHNRGWFEAGMTVVGSLAYMGWLNEYGAIAPAAHTQDIDIARNGALKLATNVTFLSSLAATHLAFHRIPGLPSQRPSTSVKLRGVDGLRVDVLAPGLRLGGTIEIPELDWHAQTIPHFDYLLEDPVSSGILAGGHCIPVKLPDAARFVWHKIYSSTRRTDDPSKSDKDLRQSVTLAAVMVEQATTRLRDSLQDAPAELRSAVAARMPRIRTLLAKHPQSLEEFSSLPL